MFPDSEIFGGVVFSSWMLMLKLRKPEGCQDDCGY